MINYDKVVIELNKISSMWDYWFDMQTILSGDGDDLWHIIYLVWRDEVKLELFHECGSEIDSGQDVIVVCMAELKSHLSDIGDFYDYFSNK